MAYLERFPAVAQLHVRSWGANSIRFSGATYGFMVGHISPEAARGGPIGLLKTGDRIVIDVEARVIETDADLSGRAPFPTPPRPDVIGAYAKYAKLVGSASQGAVTSGA